MKSLEHKTLYLAMYKSEIGFLQAILTPPKNNDSVYHLDFSLQDLNLNHIFIQSNQDDVYNFSSMIQK